MLKAPTASADKGLGSGQWDWGPGIGFAKKLISNFEVFSDVSYYFIGKVPDEETKNQVNFDSGVAYYFTDKTLAMERILHEYLAETLQRVAISYEYSSPTTAGNAASEDIALTLDFKIKDTCKLNAKGSVGLTEGSPAQNFQIGATVNF